MSNLFQKSALNSMATPEQLDQQVKIVKPRIWLGLSAFILLLAALLVWGIKGNISSTIAIEGIVFPKSGVSSLVSDKQGVIQDVLYQTGDNVQKGDVIATMPDEAILSQIQSLENEMKTAEGEKKKDYKKRREELYEQYDESSVIRASSDGMIQSIAAAGQVVSPGEEVANILVNSQYMNNRQIVAYVPLKTAKRLEAGMEAQVSPAHASREEYGYMEGYITSIGTVPVTEDSLEKYYGNLEYVADMLPDESAVEVCISVQVDENSENLFLWSNEKGNSLSVEVGTVCDIQVIVENDSPISLVF